MREHLAGSVGADLAGGWRESNVGSSGACLACGGGEGAGAQPGKGAAVRWEGKTWRLRWMWTFTPREMGRPPEGLEPRGALTRLRISKVKGVGERRAAS